MSVVFGDQQLVTVTFHTVLLNVDAETFKKTFNYQATCIHVLMSVTLDPVSLHAIAATSAGRGANKGLSSYAHAN